jgi:hypothetical protein
MLRLFPPIKSKRLQKPESTDSSSLPNPQSLEEAPNANENMTSKNWAELMTGRTINGLFSKSSTSSEFHFFAFGVPQKFIYYMVPFLDQVFSEPTNAAREFALSLY